MSFADLHKRVIAMPGVLMFTGFGCDQEKKWPVTFLDDTAQDQRDAVQALIDACPPDPPLVEPTIEGRLLIKALTDAQFVKLKGRDAARLTGDPSIPVGNSLIFRTAGVVGLDPAAWIAAARAQT